MATHSRILAWRIPEMAETSELPSLGSHRVGHNWSNIAAAHTCCISTQIQLIFVSWCFCFYSKSINNSSKASQVVLVVKNLPANEGAIRDEGFISGLGRSPGGGNGILLQYSCLENSKGRGAWWLQSMGPQTDMTERVSMGTQAHTYINHLCVI